MSTGGTSVASSLRVALVLLLIALAPALLSAWLHPRKPARERPGEVSVETVTGWREVLWVDARSPAAFAAAHVPGALPLAPEAWESQVEAVLVAWSPGTRVVVYCDGGGCRASHEVAERLRTELGLEDVHVLAGGWDAWLRAGGGER